MNALAPSRLVALCGGPAVVAAWLGLSHDDVLGWSRPRPGAPQGEIPPCHHRSLVAKAAEHGIRPDSDSSECGSEVHNRLTRASDAAPMHLTSGVSHPDVVTLRGRRAEVAFSLRSDLLADYATKAEIAATFGVSDRTIERWVRMRILPAPLRLGRKALYHVPKLRRHLEEQTATAGRRGPARASTRAEPR